MLPPSTGTVHSLGRTTCVYVNEYATCALLNPPFSFPSKTNHLVYETSVDVLLSQQHLLKRIIEMKCKETCEENYKIRKGKDCKNTLNADHVISQCASDLLYYL